MSIQKFQILSPAAQIALLLQDREVIGAKYPPRLLGVIILHRILGVITPLPRGILETCINIIQL